MQHITGISRQQLQMSSLEDKIAMIITTSISAIKTDMQGRFRGNFLMK